MPKLCKQLNCAVTCFDDSCVIHDRTSRIQIVAGEHKDGVYYFRKVVSNKAYAVNIGCLWYKRLRHPSSDTLTLLPQSLGIGYGSKKHKDDVCDICLLAKHTRTQFPLSENNAKNIFDLIHCNIWRPYEVASACGGRYFLNIFDDVRRAVWAYLMKDQTQASKVLKDFVLMMKF